MAELIHFNLWKYINKSPIHSPQAQESFDFLVFTCKPKIYSWVCEASSLSSDSFCYSSRPEVLKQETKGSEEEIVKPEAMLES